MASRQERQPDALPIQRNAVDRRTFLAGMFVKTGALAVGSSMTLSAPHKGISDLLAFGLDKSRIAEQAYWDGLSMFDFNEQEAVLLQARVSSSEFIRQQEGFLTPIETGSVFSPEWFGLTLDALTHSDQYSQNQERALDALDEKFARENPSHIRIGIQAANSYVDGHFNCTVYEPFIDRIMQNSRAKVHINYDFYKVFGWPEFHPVDEVSGKLMETGYTVKPGNKLAQMGINYNAELLGFFKEKYRDNPQMLSRIVWQPVNEPWNYPRNQFKAHISEEYLMYTMLQLGLHFSGMEVEFNASPRKLLEGAQFLKKLKKEHPDVYSRFRFRLMLDYYPLRPGGFSVPEGMERFDFHEASMDKLWPKAIPLSDEICAEIKQMGEEVGFRTGVQELQAEPWREAGKTFLQPGNDHVAFQATLLATKKYLNDTGNSIVMLYGDFARYGLDYLDKTLTLEQSQISDVLSFPNRKREEQQHPPFAA